MIPLIRFYLKLGFWKLILALTLLISLAIVGNELSAKPTGLFVHQSGARFQLPPGQYPHYPDYPSGGYAQVEPPLKRFFETFGLLLFPAIVAITIVTYFVTFTETNLALPVSRSCLFSSRIIAMILKLWLALAWLIPLAVVLARSTSPEERSSIVEPIVNILLLVLPVSVLAVWISPWVNLTQKPLRAALVALLPFLLGGLGAAASITFHNLGLIPAAVAIALAAIFYNLGLRTFSRLELAPPAGRAPAEPASTAFPTFRSLNRRLSAFFSNRFDRLSPTTRYFASAIWSNWLYLVLAATFVLQIYSCLWRMLVGDQRDNASLPLASLWALMGASLVPWVLRSACQLLPMPLSRERVLLSVIGPIILIVLVTGGIGLVVAPFTVPDIHIVAPDNQMVNLNWDRVNAQARPRDLAPMICDLLPASFGITVRPEEILASADDVSTIDLGSVLPRLRWIRFRAAILTLFLSIILVLLALCMRLPARWVYRSRFAMRIREYAWITILLMVCALSFLPLTFTFIPWDAPLRLFLLDHFWPASLFMLLAIVLLWRRHERAFRYFELPRTRNS